MTRESLLLIVSGRKDGETAAILRGQCQGSEQRTTTLMKACQANEEKLIRLLIESGVEIKVMNDNKSIIIRILG